MHLGVGVCVSMYLCVFLCVRVCVRMCVFVFVYACMRVCVCYACVCVYACVTDDRFSSTLFSCFHFLCRFLDHETTVRAFLDLNGCETFNRRMVVEVDPGFFEGRQYGQGGKGGQVSVYAVVNQTVFSKQGSTWIFFLCVCVCLCVYTLGRV